MFTVSAKGEAFITVTVEMRLSTLRRIQDRAYERNRRPGPYLTSVIEGIFSGKPRRKVTRIHAEDHEQLTLTG